MIKEFIYPLISSITPVYEIQNNHIIFLTISVAATDALLHTLRIPRKVIVDEQAAKLEVNTFCGGLCPYKDASLDALMDEYEYDPTPTTDDTDPVMLKMAYEDLLAYLADKPRTHDIVTTGFAIGSIDGNLAVGDRKELVKLVMDKYGLEKSQAYNVVRQALKEVVKYFRS